MADFYNQTAAEVIKKFHTDGAKGLSTQEATNLQSQYGKNTLKVAGIPLWRKILEPFLDIFMFILIIAMVLSCLQQNWLEAVTILIIIAINAVIYYIQQFSTEKILRSLKRSTIHAVTVIRDNHEQNVEATELVPGDIVVLHEGDRIPADGRIISESGLLTNESMLTGESDAIAKDAKALSGTRKVYEQKNMMFSGSFVITGSDKFVVTATGDDTEYGRIASLASSLGEDSPIQKKMNRLVSRVAIIVVVIAAIVLVIQLIDQIPVLEALQFTLAMVVSAVPEGLPIAISIILALCAARMAKKHALIRELKAIESIGIVTTIATDKTGTLTENRLELREFWAPEISAEDFYKRLARATLGEVSPCNESAKANLIIDPLDVCILNFLRKNNIESCLYDSLRSYAFDQSLKLSGNLFRDGDNKYLLQVKGAPETILARSRMSNKELVEANAKLIELANHGFKVVAVASAKIDHEINELSRLDKNVKFDFDGFIAVADALRKSVPTAIRQATRMGVKTKMITGDHAGTAFAIGREAGIAEDFSQVLDCSNLANINDDDLVDSIKTATVFARVTPEDKYRILSAMKKTELCAMTGDGVNDVPALVGAHVGIAMGDAPSIVQDAGDIVLLDNNFKNITEAIKESRTVLANIRRMLIYLLATNAGEVITMLGALLISGHQLLTPIQILWINLVTDSLMVIPIGLEPPEQSVLRQKPEHKDAPLLSFKLLLRMCCVAVVMSLSTLATYYLAKWLLNDTAQANTLAFTALVVMQWSNAVSIRGTYESALARLKVRHVVFHLALGVAVILQLLVLFSPLAQIVNIVAVPVYALAITAVLAFLIPLMLFELLKKIH